MGPQAKILLVLFLVFFGYICFFVLMIYLGPQQQLKKWVVLDPKEKYGYSRTKGAGSIPLHIHQTWKSHHLPEPYRSLSAEIRRLHPQYQYTLWDDRASYEFIRDHYSWFLPVYQNYDVKMKKIDAVRYFWLYHYGGIYMDLDSVTLQPLDKLIKDRSLLFGYAERNTRKHNAIPNAFMASARHHPFLGWLLRQLPKTQKLDIVHATGPNFLTHCLRVWEMETPDHVLPMPILYTHSWYEPVREKNLQALRNKYPKSFVTTFWSHSWKNQPAHT